MLSIFKKFYQQQKGKDILYLTIAESFFGNLRDLVFYFLIFSKLNKTVIHLLGGANFMNILRPRLSLIYFMNKFFISKIGAVIVEGLPQKQVFSGIVNGNRITINPNFAEEYLFITESTLLEKFSNIDKLKVLFLSNHLKGKGYEELSSAYIGLDKKYKDMIEIDFVGDFPKDGTKEIFLAKIKDEPSLKYHGPLRGESKREMYHNAHVFCMPTYYPYEGQPFCIVEAYASGCFVITTNHSGINYIFTDKKNGIEVEKKSIESIKKALIECIEARSLLKKIGEFNLNEARKKYNLKSYLEGQNRVLDKIN